MKCVNIDPRYNAIYYYSLNLRSEVTNVESEGIFSALKLVKKYQGNILTASSNADTCSKYSQEHSA